MAAQTEAACLLETGALYTKRLVLQPLPGDPIFAGFKSGAFSLYFGDAPIYHFDLEGRWQRAFADGLHYLKGLDGTVQAIDRVREGKNMVLKRRTLGYAEASDLDARIRAEALSVLEALGQGRLDRVLPPASAEPLTDDELSSFLERVATWDPAAWFAQRERYLGTYGPLPLLPPDCLQAMILQATLGHAGGRSFGLGPVHEHYIRSLGEFEEHAQVVARLYGMRRAQCKGVFLAGSDVLRQPEAEVLGYLRLIGEVLGPTPAGSAEEVHAFLDDLSTPRPSRDAWRRYAEQGLRRVTLGVESGAPEVRALYGRSWNDENLPTVVSDLKAAGIGVGLMTLVGAGGAENADRHLAATATLFNALPLDPGDLVSLLDAREVAASESATTAQAPFTALTGAAWSEQQAALKSQLAPLRSERGAKVVPYSLEKQG